MSEDDVAADCHNDHVERYTYDNLKAENERLRSALEEIALQESWAKEMVKGDAVGLVGIAKRALEAKP